MTNSIQKNRLHKEIMDLERDPPPGITCYPKEDDITELEAYIKGPPDSPFEKGLFKLAIQVPDRYPFEPPQMKFITTIYHPNIDDTGRICADILKSGSEGSWKPAINISTALMSLRQLLATPNPDDPLDAEIAKEYQLDYPTFLQNAREYTAKYASEEAVMNDDGETKDEKMEEATELKNKDVDMDIIEEEELEERKPKVSLSLSKKKGSSSNNSSQSISSQSVQSSLDNDTTKDTKPKKLLSKTVVKLDKIMVDTIEKPQKIEKVKKSSNIDDVEKGPKIQKLKLEKVEKLEEAENVKKIEAVEKVEIIEKVEKLKKPEISKKVKKVEKVQTNAEQVKISTDDEFEIVDKAKTLKEEKPVKVEVGRRAEEIELISDDEVVIVEKIRKIEQHSKKINIKKTKNVEDVEKSKKIEKLKKVDNEVAVEKIKKNRTVASSSLQKKKSVTKDHAVKKDSTDKREKDSTLKENNVNKEEELEPVIIIKKHGSNVLNLSSQKLKSLPNLSFPPKRESGDQSNAIDLDSKLPKKETNTLYFSSFTDNAIQETKSFEINSNDKDVAETASSNVAGILSESTEMNICNDAKRSFASFLSQDIIELSDDDDDVMNSTPVYHSLQLSKKTKRNKISLSKKKPSKDI